MMRLLTSAIAMIIASTASADPSPPPPTCADAIVFVLVGSGQHVKSSTDLTVSPQLEAIFTGAVSALAPAHTIAARVIDYPAESTHVLWDGVTIWNVDAALNSNLQRYLAGEQAGLAALRDDVVRVAAACPASKLALIGYSQGAMIVHQYLNELAAVASPPSIAGAVVLADPERVAQATPIELGTAPPRSHGVCAAAAQWASCTPGAALADIRAPYARITASVCASGDAVCDTSELIGSIVRDPRHAKDQLRRGAAIHSAYASQPATVDAGRWLAQRITGG